MTNNNNRTRKRGVMDLENKQVTIIGLGNSGVNAALLAQAQGAVVRATDAGDGPELKKVRTELQAKGIEVEIGSHTDSFIKGADLVVVSPGVEKSSIALKMASHYKVPVVGEMEFGFVFCRGRVIAITGTNGKSTVTTLIGDILSSGGKDCVVCGNIGNSLCGEISRIKEDTWVVLEVSSAQLEYIKTFKPRIALILNITDDHMDRYRTFYEYFNEKLKIFSMQDENDILILNYDAENLRRLKGLARSRALFYAKEEGHSNGYTMSAYMKDAKIICAYGGVVKEVLSYRDIRLKGIHNLENVLASCLVGIIAGVAESSIRQTVRDFTGLDHRFETVDTIDGVEYIDDSKGTTVDSTKRALESCVKPVVLIAGGKDKFSDYGKIKEVVEQRVKHLVLIGEAAAAIKKALGRVVTTHEAKTLTEAVEIAAKLATDGWAVLLSPMCSSFDMFKNYKERGKVFQVAVKKLRAGHQAVKAQG